MKNKLNFSKIISKECEDLIKKLLTHNKNERIKIKDVFLHPWVYSFEKEYQNMKTLVTNECTTHTNTNDSTNSNIQNLSVDIYFT